MYPSSVTFQLGKRQVGLDRVAAVVMACLVALPARVAFAADAEVERTLAIVELRGGTDPSSLTMDYLKAVVAGFREENSGDFILVGADRIAEKIGRDRDQVPSALTDERRVALAEAKKKGIQFLDNADTAKAIEALKAAERSYRAALAAPGSDDALRKEYLDVLAQLATAYVVAKDKDSAAEVFRTVITAFGLKAPINDDNYRPDVVEEFKKVVKEANSTQKGSLEVASSPVGARIILSGIDRGVTPGTVTDLIPGTYSMRLQHGTTTSMLRRVKISGGAATKVSIDVPFESHLILEDKHVGIMYADLETAKQRLHIDVATLGRDLEVNMVCVIGVLDQKLVTFLIDVGQDKVERSSSIKVPQVGISNRAVTRVLATILGEKDGSGAASSGPATPWYTSTAGLATGGAAVVSLAVGAIFMGSLFNTNAANATEKADIESSRVVSGVGLGLGAALGAVAGFFFYKHAQSNNNAQLDAVQSGGRRPISLPPALGAGPVRFSAPIDLPGAAALPVR